MATRSRKEERTYKKYLKSLPKSAGHCVFCKVMESQKNQIIKEYKHFTVIKNIFAYSLWENTPVADHIMVVPKRHTPTMSDFSKQEKLEFMDIVSPYEDKGYNLYARATSSKTKSIPHQHTHLIKNKGTQKKFVLSWKKFGHIRIAT